MKNKIFILMLLFLGGNLYALDRSDIRDGIRLRIKDTNSERQRYTDAQLNNLINQEQRDVVNLTGIIKSNTDIVLSTGTTYYSIPSTVISIDRITLDFKDLPEATLKGLDSENSGGAWALTSGKPQKYFQDPARPGQIGVFPWPQALLTTGTLHVNYFADADDMVDDTDVPFNGSLRYLPYHDLLIYGISYKIELTEGDAPKAQEYRGYYESRILLLGNKDQSPNFLPGLSGQRK